MMQAFRDMELENEVPQGDIDDAIESFSRWIEEFNARTGNPSLSVSPSAVERFKEWRQGGLAVSVHVDWREGLALEGHHALENWFEDLVDENLSTELDDSEFNYSICPWHFSVDLVVFV